MELHYLRVYESNAGGWVDLHPLHGADELPDNLEICKLLANQGYQLELLPCIDQHKPALRQKFLPDVFGNKNPDVRINGILIGDIKTLDKNTIIRKPTISNAISSAAIQKVEVAILNLVDRQYTVQDVKKGIVGALQPNRNRSIGYVWIMTKNKNLFTISRKMVFEDSLYEALDYL
jgi:hypothetical protein